MGSEHSFFSVAYWGGVELLGIASVWAFGSGRGLRAFLSSCLAGTLVAFGRQAAWWPGAHCELVSTSCLVALSRQSLRAVTARDLCSNCGAFISLGGSQRLKRHSSKRQLRGVTMPQRRRLYHGWTWVNPLRRQASSLRRTLKSNDHLSSRVASRVVLCCQLGLGVR